MRLHAAARGARQQQIGYVDACDQQNESHRAGERHQRRARIARNHVANGNQAHPKSAIGAGMSTRNIRLDCRHFLLRLCQVYARAQPRHDAQILTRIVAPCRRRKTQRNPQFDHLRVLKSGRHDADHGAGLAIELNLPPDDIPVCMKGAAPQPVAQDDDARRAGLILLRPEDPAQLRFYTQQRKVAGRKLIPDQKLRIAGAGERQFVVGRRGHPFEDMVARLPFREYAPETASRSMFFAGLLVQTVIRRSACR